MASLTVENYVKAIYLLCTEQDENSAATGKLARALEVSPGTVTSMLKTLSDSGLATYTPYAGVELTSAGKGLALRIIRRHRLIEQFLVETLGLSWDEVHEEAENMEHSVSDRLIDRIDEYLGFPSADPHGDPIPRADGTVQEDRSQPLSRCRVGEAFRVARVLDQSPEFLRYLSESALSVGARGKVTANRAEARIVSVAIDDRECAFGHDAADKILVTTCDE